MRVRHWGRQLRLGADCPCCPWAAACWVLPGGTPAAWQSCFQQVMCGCGERGAKGGERPSVKGCVSSFGDYCANGRSSVCRSRTSVCLPLTVFRTLARASFPIPNKSAHVPASVLCLWDVLLPDIPSWPSSCFALKRLSLP